MPVALLTWLAAWLLGQVVALIVYSAGGYNDVDEVPIWVLFVSQLLVWGIFLVAMALASRARGAATSSPTTRSAPAPWTSSACRSGC